MQAGQEKLGADDEPVARHAAPAPHDFDRDGDERSSLRDELTEMMSRGVGVVAGAGMGRTVPGARPPLTR
jgi:hypothetical protein